MKTTEIKIDFNWAIDRSMVAEDEMYEKLENTLNKFGFDYMNVTCEIKKDGITTFVVKLVLEIPKYKTIVVKGDDKELMNAFDKARHNLFNEMDKANTIKRNY